ncbi:MAG: AAA family ATPase [Bdellovibrionales bacterium]|nr:AAA family ATPase [Oligoflexia bacterium]
MLSEALLQKRCIMVCGGGGVGKTTIAASLAIAAARVRPRVLVVTIDPAKRLLEAFGFTDAFLQEGGEPLALSNEVLAELGLPATAQLSIAVLNPKYVLNQVLEQTLSPVQQEKLKNTLLYRELSQMIYGLQEYTAYEWVTRMIGNNEYDLIVLDTPPALHAKDFFNAPNKIRNLMESRVFQIFLPKKHSWFTSVLSFGWMEKLIGKKIFSESRIFFETFIALRDRILERCDLLSKFFKDEHVSVIAVGTPEVTAQIELEGLVQFLKERSIPIETLIVNQVDEKISPKSSRGRPLEVPAAVQEKWNLLLAHQEAKAERAHSIVEKLKNEYKGYQLLTVPMRYSQEGFDILKENSLILTSP